MMGSVQTIVRGLCAISLLLAVGFGCAAGHGPGEGCTVEGDCHADLTCFDGECTAPGSCPRHAPISCGDGSCCISAQPICCGDGNCYTNTADCKAAMCASSGKACTLSSDCCTGLTCQGGACKTPLPTCAGKSCSTSAGCCTGFTCSRFGHFCQAAKTLPIGEACTNSAQCASNLCLNYCTKSCTGAATCSGVTDCLSTTNGFLCIPFCQTSADCTVFGPGITCQAGTDPGNLTLNGCFGP